MSQRISMVMQKGGVGKTTLTVNLAAAMAGALKQRVLVVDLDTQRNATQSILGFRVPDEPSIANVIRGEMTVQEAAQTSEHSDRLHVLPGSRWLVEWERKLQSWDKATLRVREILTRGLDDAYDVILIDTPPAGGLWLQSALASSTGYAVVTQCEAFGWNGIRDIIETANYIAENANPQLRLQGVIVNRYRSHTIEHSGFLKEYRKHFGDALLQPWVPDRIAVPEAARWARPIEFETSRSVRDLPATFQLLAKALLERGDVIAREPAMVGG